LVEAQRSLIQSPALNVQNQNKSTIRQYDIDRNAGPMGSKRDGWMIERRVLVVDDEPDARQIINQLLRFHAIACDTAADAEAALALLTSGHYDAAIIDLALPIMHGWQLVQQIRDNPQTAAPPCVTITPSTRP
jgi:response regulator RpfG family c-di-GMP phosphodiesterase